MKKVSYDKFDEYASTFDPEYNLLEEQLKRREAMAIKLADLLNEKIDECEKLKEELAHYKYLYKVVSLHEENS